MRLAVFAVILGGAIWLLVPATPEPTVETAASCTTCDARKAGLQSLRDARAGAEDTEAVQGR